jgi:hypothetical protein
MIKLFFYSLLILAIPVFCQESGKLHLDVGISQRFYPLSLENKVYSLNPRGISFSGSKHFKNYNFSIDFIKNLNNKISFKLSNYLRYNHNHYRHDSDPITKTEIKKIKYDVFLDFLYGNKFKKAKDLFFKMGLGWGMMNINSGYQFNQVVGFDSTGYPRRDFFQGSFRFSAPRFIMGIQKLKWQGFFTMNITPDSNFERYFSLWPELKLSYTLTRTK